MNAAEFDAKLQEAQRLEKQIESAGTDEEAERYFQQAVDLYAELEKQLTVNKLDNQSGSFEWLAQWDMSAESEELAESGALMPTFHKKNTNFFVRRLRDFENRRRLPLFHKNRRLGGKVVIVEGDSWTQHPFIDDLVDQFLNQGFATRGFGTATHLLEQLVETDEYKPVLEAINTYEAEYLVLSCGGNDTIGEQFIHTMLRKADPFEPFAERFLDRKKAGEHLERMKRFYDELIDAYLDDAHEGLKIIIHGYAYGAPVPWKHPAKTNRLDNWFLEKKWLSKGLNKVKAHHTLERWEITKHAIDLYNEMLRELVKEREGRVIYVDLRTELNSNRIDDVLGGLDGNRPILDDDDELKIRYERLAQRYWSDELHPDKNGFERLARAIAAKIE